MLSENNYDSSKVHSALLNFTKVSGYRDIENTTLEHLIPLFSESSIVIVHSNYRDLVSIFAISQSGRLIFE